MAEEETAAENVVTALGSYKGSVRLITCSEDSEESTAVAEEIMLLWGIQQPIFSKHNAFVKQASLQLQIDACGRSIYIQQSPSSLGTAGVTGAVMWDSGIVLGKFLEHSVESKTIVLQDKKVVELGSGCGLVGCIAALLGAQVVLTDLPDRLKLLKKNVENNLSEYMRGNARASELIWGDHLDPQLTNPLPDYVLGSDVVYSEGSVVDLMETLVELCGRQTTVFIAAELRNDAILEYFLEAATKEFIVGRIDQKQWHPEYCSSRVVIYILVKQQIERQS